VDALKKHWRWNKAHIKKRVADKELFSKVKLQTWFQGKRERYWVEVSANGKSRDCMQQD
jgi:hypothetical protein